MPDEFDAEGLDPRLVRLIGFCHEKDKMVMLWSWRDAERVVEYPPGDPRRPADPAVLLAARMADPFWGRAKANLAEFPDWDTQAGSEYVDWREADPDWAVAHGQLPEGSG